MPNKFVFPIAFLFLIACLPLYGQNNIERDRVGYYPLDGDGRDLGKYKNSGELIGTPEIAENRIGEKEAIAFDGDDWIVCSPNPMSIRSAVSVSLWVKTTDDKTKTVTLVGKYNPREFRGFNIIMKYGKISIGGRDGTKPNRKERRSNFRSSKFSDTMIADGKWHHVVGMVSDDTWSIYVDGLLESKQHFNTEKTLLRNTAPLVIGNASFEAKESSDFRGLDGALDDLMLFKRALTEEEIQTLAQDNFFSSGMDSEANEILEKGIQAERIGLVDSAIIYFDQASVLYQKLKSDKERALALALAARNYLADNNVAMAIEKNLKSLFLTTNLKEDNSGEKGLVTQQQLLNLTQHNIAKINFFNGDLENAKSKLNFPINRKNTNNFYSDEIAKIYLTKAEAFYEMGDYRKTTNLCKDSVLFFLENKEDHKKLIAENEMMHGRALIAQGKTQEGIQKLVKARQFFQTIEEGKNVQVIRSIKYLAEGYLKLNNKQKALELIQTALIKNSYEFENQSVANNPSLTDFVHQREAVHLLSLKASSLYEYSKSNPKDASPLEIANKTCYLASEVLANLNDELNVLQGPRMEIRQQFIGVYKRGIQIAYELYRTSKNEYYLYQAFYFSEMSKNSLLLEAVLGNLAKSENTLSNDLLEKERELRQNYFKDFEYFAELQNQGLSFYSSFNKEQENQLTNARKLWQEFSYKLQNEYLNYQKLRTQPIIAPFKEIRKKLSPT